MRSPADAAHAVRISPTADAFSAINSRRTHASLLDELGVDPQVRADQMGHSVDVNQNTYTRSSLERRRTAVNQLEKAVGVV